MNGQQIVVELWRKEGIFNEGPCGDESGDLSLDDFFFLMT
jgi:hypothetical protein